MICNPHILIGIYAYIQRNVSKIILGKKKKNLKKIALIIQLQVYSPYSVKNNYFHLLHIVFIVIYYQLLRIMVIVSNGLGHNIDMHANLSDF